MLTVEKCRDLVTLFPYRLNPSWQENWNFITNFLAVTVYGRFSKVVVKQKGVILSNVDYYFSAFSMQLKMVFCPTHVCPLTYSQFKFGKQVPMTSCAILRSNIKVTIHHKARAQVCCYPWIGDHKNSRNCKNGFTNLICINNIVSKLSIVKCHIISENGYIKHYSPSER